MIYLKLFWSFFQIGLFSIGGGFAAIPLIQNQIVEVNKWLTLKEFTDLITIAEMTPGPIAINSATFVGLQIAGIRGALISTIGCILPSCIIVAILTFMFTKYKDLKVIKGVLSGLRPAIIAFIAGAGLTILKLAIFENDFKLNIISLFLFIGAVFLLRRYKVSPIFVILGVGLVSSIFEFI